MTTSLLMLAGEPARLAEALAALHGHDPTAWVGTRADDDPLAATAYGSRWPYGGFVSLEHPDPVDPLLLEHRLGATLETLGDIVDRSASTVIVGTTHRIIDGRTDVALVYAIHRLPGLTTDEYQHHWLHRHGPLAKELVPTSGYEQTHADLDAGRRLAARLGLADAGFDGNATCFFPSRDRFADMLTARESSSETNVIYEDERRFLDHANSLGAMMRQAVAGGAAL